MIDNLRFKAENEEQVKEAINLCERVGITIQTSLDDCGPDSGYDWSDWYWGFYYDGDFGQPFVASRVVSFEEWMKTVKEHYNVEEEKKIKEVKASDVRITRVEFDVLLV